MSSETANFHSEVKQYHNIITRASEELNIVNTRLEHLEEKNKELEEETIQKGEKLNLLQNLSYGISFLVILILVLTIFLS